MMSLMRKLFLVCILAQSLKTEILVHNFWFDLCNSSEILETNLDLSWSIFFERNFSQGKTSNTYDHMDLVNNFNQHLKEITEYNQRLLKFQQQYIN